MKREFVGNQHGHQQKDSEVLWGEASHITASITVIFEDGGKLKPRGTAVLSAYQPSTFL